MIMTEITIQALRNDVISFTQELIRIPSLTGEEGEVAQLILEKLGEISVDEAFIDGIGNVVGVLKGDSNGPNIMLNGHLDIVPAGRVENWHGYDPFGGEIDKDGNIHGRGAADIKGGVSVQLFTMKLLKSLVDRGINLPGNVIFSQVVHEESAEMLGMEYLFRETLPEKGINIDVVLLCEPTGLKVILGQRGKVELVITTSGRTAHSSVPHKGVNALQKMLPVLDRIFNEMGTNLQKHPDLGQGSVTVTNLICRPGAQSMTPDECEISVDYRYLPGQSLENIIADFNQMFKEIRLDDPAFEAEIHVRTFLERSYTGYQKEVQRHHPLWIIERNHVFVQKTLQALQRVSQDPEVGYWEFGTDGGMSAGILGIPTIGYSGAEECYAHTSEEQVNIDMLMQSLEGYFAIVCELFAFDSDVLIEATHKA
jgi:putative selenium metabolism hydrolase